MFKRVRCWFLGHTLGEIIGPDFWGWVVFCGRCEAMVAPERLPLKDQLMIKKLLEDPKL